MCREARRQQPEPTPEREPKQRGGENNGQVCGSGALRSRKTVAVRDVLSMLFRMSFFFLCSRVSGLVYAV
ncbi:hypothetical protein AAFF_G00092170 [Aldrovandia affinis]|uniref:Uncharacterized protein n=1 Tax=Aldrovandia affinis TaxID=143900 RepID=A0AAD7T2M6_9TELE|nr:hypothetical protein AAFF_G00092170 [Aldrovandia affinis]